MALLLAYGTGVQAGMLGVLLAAAALVASVVLLRAPPDTPGELAWRLPLLLSVTATAAALGVLRDRLRGLHLREREARAAAETAARHTHRVLEHIADGFIVLDRDGRFSYANRSAQLLLQRSAAELLGRPVQEVYPPSLYRDFYRGFREAAKQGSSIHYEARTPTGTWYEINITIAPEGVAIYFRDITERRQHEEQLRGMTLVDELTGLYNRRGFFALAEEQYRLAQRKDRSLFLVFVDVDHLKRINDTLGHTVGDQAIFEAAAVLRHTFRETDVVARIGGDEFAAIFLAPEPDTPARVLRRLEENVQHANAEGGLPFELSLSCGVASYDPDSPTPIGELLSQADRRMYERKRRKRGEADAS